MEKEPVKEPWISQVERWCPLITERAIRRNSTTSVRELKQQVELFLQRYNVNTTPSSGQRRLIQSCRRSHEPPKRPSATGH